MEDTIKENIHIWCGGRKEGGFTIRNHSYIMSVSGVTSIPITPNLIQTSRLSQSSL